MALTKEQREEIEIKKINHFIRRNRFQLAPNNYYIQPSFVQNYR